MELIDGATAELLCVPLPARYAAADVAALEYHHHQRQEDEHRVEQRRVPATPINNGKPASRTASGSALSGMPCTGVHATDHVSGVDALMYAMMLELKEGKHNTRQQ